MRQQSIDVSLLLVGSSNSLGLVESSQDCPVSQELKQLANELDFAEFL